MSIMTETVITTVIDHMMTEETEIATEIGIAIVTDIATVNAMVTRIVTADAVVTIMKRCPIFLSGILLMCLYV